MQSAVVGCAVHLRTQPGEARRRIDERWGPWRISFGPLPSGAAGGDRVPALLLLGPAMLFSPCIKQATPRDGMEPARGRPFLEKLMLLELSTLFPLHRNSARVRRALPRRLSSRRRSAAKSTGFVK